MNKPAIEIDFPIDPKAGVLGMFSTPESLKEAAKLIRDKKIKKFDAFSPFPVHGIEEAMGLDRSPLPWVTFCAGLTGGSLGLLFQWWTSAVDWALNVGGKPFASWPAFIPVTFECTVLFAGLATAGALFVLCRIPKVNPKILDSELTNDKFGLFVSSEDPLYKEQELTDLLKKAGAYAVRTV
ncbi:MAG: DUF3341 domain-containing protein [Bacteriovoracia bacterium]